MGMAFEGISCEALEVIRLDIAKTLRTDLYNGTKGMRGSDHSINEGHKSI